MSLAARSPYGHPLTTNAGGTVTRVPFSAPTLAALLALASTDPACTHGNEVMVDADGGGIWVWNSASTLTADNLFVGAASDAPATGRWERRGGQEVDILIPIPFASADATVLATLQAGFQLDVYDADWKVTTTLTTASAAGAGISSSNAGCSTKGDLLGGATGDVVATLVSTGVGNFVAGTGGAKVIGTNTQRRALKLVSGDTIRYDLFTGTFTGGVFFARIKGYLRAPLCG